MKKHILFIFLIWLPYGLFAESITNKQVTQEDKNVVSKDGGDSFKDSRDGKTYKTVRIVNQVWIAENLNYDGDANAYRKLIEGGGSRFNMLFGGWRLGNGDYGHLGSYANFWSSSGSEATYAWSLSAYRGSQRANLYDTNKDDAFSVCCIQD